MPDAGEVGDTQDADKPFDYPYTKENTTAEEQWKKTKYFDYTDAEVDGCSYRPCQRKLPKGPAQMPAS